MREHVKIWCLYPPGGLGIKVDEWSTSDDEGAGRNWTVLQKSRMGNSFGGNEYQIQIMWMRLQDESIDMAKAKVGRRGEPSEVVGRGEWSRLIITEIFGATNGQAKIFFFFTVGGASKGCQKELTRGAPYQA